MVVPWLGPLTVIKVRCVPQFPSTHTVFYHTKGRNTMTSFGSQIATFSAVLNLGNYILTNLSLASNKGTILLVHSVSCEDECTAVL